VPARRVTWSGRGADSTSWWCGDSSSHLWPVAGRCTNAWARLLRRGDATQPERPWSMCVMRRPGRAPGGAEELAARALAKIRQELAAGRTDRARLELLRVEAMLGSRAAHARSRSAVAAIDRAKREVGSMRAELQRRLLRPHGASKRPTESPDVAAQLSQAAQLIGMGQLVRARAVLALVASRLEDEELPAFHPSLLTLQRLQQEVEPLARTSAPPPADARSTSVRTVSGGLPGMGGRR
jgi:hypothetical protein